MGTYNWPSCPRCGSGAVIRCRKSEAVKGLLAMLFLLPVSLILVVLSTVGHGSRLMLVLSLLLVLVAFCGLVLEVVALIRPAPFHCKNCEYTFHAKYP